MSHDVSMINSNELQSKIYTIRGLQVMLDSDLAELYGVENKRLNEQVKRNITRFPTQFRFELTQEEFENLQTQIVTSSGDSLRSQFATLEKGRGQHRKYLPFVFTEQGVSMLSAVLRSDTAIDAKDIKPEQGIFYDGEIFDAYVFVTDLIKRAKKSIVLIDNYVDENTLTLLDKRQAGCAATIYTHTVGQKLKLDLQKHNEQYPAIEIKTFKQSHDRFLILDEHEIYHFGASLKDLGKKWFAFSKFDKGALEVLGKLGHE